MVRLWMIKMVATIMKPKARLKYRIEAECYVPTLVQ